MRRKSKLIVVGAAGLLLAGGIALAGPASADTSSSSGLICENGRKVVEYWSFWRQSWAKRTVPSAECARGSQSPSDGGGGWNWGWGRPAAEKKPAGPAQSVLGASDTAGRCATERGQNFDIGGIGRYLYIDLTVCDNKVSSIGSHVMKNSDNQPDESYRSLLSAMDAQAMSSSLTGLDEIGDADGLSQAYRLALYDAARNIK